MELLITAVLLAAVFVFAYAFKVWCEAQENKALRHELDDAEQMIAKLELEVSWCKDYFGERALQSGFEANQVMQRDAA